MNENISNLVQAVANGDALATETAFSAAMADKLVSKLDTMRLDVAQTMFRGEEDPIEESTIISEEDFNSLSEEEQQEYQLVSEEEGPTQYTTPEDMEKRLNTYPEYRKKQAQDKKYSHLKYGKYSDLEKDVDKQARKNMTPAQNVDRDARNRRQADAQKVARDHYAKTGKFPKKGDRSPELDAFDKKYPNKA